VKKFSLTLSLVLALFSIISPVQSGQEIELKFICTSPEDHKKLLGFIQNNATQINQLNQKDTYIVRKDKNAWDMSKGYKDSLEVWRVREINSTNAQICYKKTHLDPDNKKITHRDEHETSVGDPTIALTILGALAGPSDTTVIEKQRTTYLYNDLVEIVFDTVINLGSFIEIELKQPVDSPQVGIQIIEDFLKSSGISEIKLFNRSYVHMAWNPNYDFSTTHKFN
jgi:predicted adenylyl cyclase CyaB